MNKLFKTWRGLPSQLFLLVILPFAVLALAATLMSLGLHQNAMRSMIAERDVRAVVTTAQFLGSKIQLEQEVANVLAIQSETRSLEIFVREHDYISRNLGLVSDQGVVLSFSGTGEIEKLLGTLSFTPGILQSIDVDESKALVFSSLSQSGVTAVNIVLIKPLLVEIIGDGFAAHGQETAFLVDANAEELARVGSMQGESQTASHPGVTEALSGKSGFTYLKITSMEHVVAYSPVQPPGWALVFEEPWEEVDTPYLRLTQFAPLILIPLLAFTLVALWFGATQIVKPLQQLENLASRCNNWRTWPLTWHGVTSLPLKNLWVEFRRSNSFKKNSYIWHTKYRMRKKACITTLAPLRMARKRSAAGWHANCTMKHCKR